MPEITTVVFDNALNSQNQDYFPSRFVLQKEIIDGMITQILENNIENLIGLIPLSQDVKNNILTPTKTRSLLSTFLHETDLVSVPDHVSSLFQADQSLNVGEYSSKTLICFLSSPVERFDETFVSIYGMVAKSISVRVVCFGDAVEFGNFIKKELNYDNFECLVIDKDQDFSETVGNFLLNSYEIDDPELKEAIKRSLQQ